jgi:hypothetical protein
MNVELDILLRVAALLEHPVVEDIRDLRNLPRGMHDRHVLLDPQRSALWGWLMEH